MISYIQGKVLYADGASAVLLTESGIGYEVRYAYYAKASEVIGVHTYHSIKENDQSLWGFRSIEDKKVFELLLKVNKVGPSKAYPLVTALGTTELINAILFDRPSVLTQAQGIGKKMAEQIILTLKEKVQSLAKTQNELIPDLDVSIDQVPSVNNTQEFVDSSIVKEAVLALESLGYKEKDFMPCLNKNLTSSLSNSEDLIKVVLKEM